MHIALARKYRPQNFLEVIGQDPIIKTIQNAIETDHLHHAYLFCGVRGVGKTSMARILAKSINCLENGPTITPCQKCAACESITQGKSLDVIEIDGASNNLVDDVRELREQVKYLPNNCKYKIIIIDEVHMLSNSAFNALLKTLEEPPAHVIFIFATTESHKIPITILSRCQKYDFRKLNTPKLLEHLKKISDTEQFNVTEGALHLIAQCAQGSVRDALSLLDQVHSLQSESIDEAQVRELLGLADRLLLQETFGHIITENLEASLQGLTKVDERGIDLKLFAEDLLKQFRHLVLFESTQKIPSDLSPSEEDFFKTLKGKVEVSLLLAQYQVLFQSIQELSHSNHQRTIFEITLVKLHQIRHMIGLADLVDQIKNKRGAKAPVPARPAPPQPRAANSNQPVPKVANDNQAPSTGPSSDWYGLVKWITKEKPPLGTLLKDAIPVNYSDKLIEIAISPKSQTKGILIERVSTIENMINTHFGKPIPFTISELSEEKKKP